MPDLSSGFDIPNPYGLMAADFEHDMDGYGAALKFLSDLAGGSDHDDALHQNGGNPILLTGWKRNRKFRRVYDKCASAGKVEQAALRARESAPDATDGENGGSPQGQRFVPFEEVPVISSPFSQRPPAGSWGGV